MTPRYVLEQLDRFQKDTDWEDEDIKRWWASGGIGSDYMIPHNQGHRIAIEAIRCIVKSMDRLDRDSLKKFAKSQIQKCQDYLNKVDQCVIDKEGEKPEWNEEYFRKDGMDCAYKTILNILKGNFYFDKNPKRPEWLDEWSARKRGEKL